MNPSPLADWVFLAVGFPIGLAGVLLLLWALFSDRSRGRARCPKCWYDVGGIPATYDAGVTCPECGRAGLRERDLARTRRRWRWATVGLVVAATGLGVSKIPGARANGWPGLVPTWALVYVTPMRDGPNAVMFARTSFPGGVPGPTPSIASQLEAEAWRRVSAGRAWDWQSRVLILRWMARQRFAAEDIFLAPQRWPVGEPVPVYFRPTNPVMFGGEFSLERREAGMPSIWGRGSREGHAPPLKLGDTAISAGLWFTVGSASVRISNLVLPCRAVERSELLERVNGAEVNEVVRRVLDPRLVAVGASHGVDVIVADRASTPEWAAIDFGLAFGVEVVMDGRTVARGRGQVNWDYPVWKTWQQVEMQWDAGAIEAVLADPAKARFVVTGDYESAVNDYLRWPFSKGRGAAWTGRFECPVRVDAVREGR